METEAKIPIIIGVTGHRQIREQDRSAVYTAVITELAKLQRRYPNSSFVMLSSLAEGGDLLCADAAEELGIPLIAALPREREDFKQDFSTQGNTRFDHHCNRAEQLFVAPDTEPLPGGGSNRDYRFRQTGIYIAAHSHILLALWDGGPGTAAACGTAEAVDFALNGSYYPENGVSVRSGSNEAVLHIFTPRGERNGEAAGTVHMLGNWETVSDALRKTDEFNRQAGEIREDMASRLPLGAGTDPRLATLEMVGRKAGKLSRLSAKRYRRILGLLAVSSAVLTFAFLMYDSARLIWMILVCGFMLFAAWGCTWYAIRSDCHRRYLEYRSLSECLRVQTYLIYAGARVRAEELLSWTQQESV